MCVVLLLCYLYCFFSFILGALNLKLLDTYLTTTKLINDINSFEKNSFLIITSINNWACDVTPRQYISLQVRSEQFIIQLYLTS